jgi:hypothetical protein
MDLSYIKVLNPKVKINSIGHEKSIKNQLNIIYFHYKNNFDNLEKNLFFRLMRIKEKALGILVFCIHKL